MRIVSGFIIRQVAGESIAVPSGESAHQLSGLVALNETGEFLFDMLQTEQTEDTLIQAMLNAYDVDISTAQQDVYDFLNMLRENGLLLESP